MRLLCAILLICYLALRCSGENLDVLYTFLGLSLDGIGKGRVWQLVSYGCIHATWWHLLVNGMLLWLLGCKLQHILDKRRALIVTLLGVLAGGLAHLVFNLFLPQNQQGLLVGISGGVMALLLCLTTLDPDHQLKPLRMRAKHLGLGFLLSALFLSLMTPSLEVIGLSRFGGVLAEIFGKEMFYVSHACHFGGGLAGLFYGRSILRNLSSSRIL